MASNESIHGIWNTKPLQAGLAIYPRVPRHLRPAWAAGILAACCARVRDVPLAIKHVLAIAGDPSLWHDAHDAFSAVRDLTLAAEQGSDSGPPYLLLYVAECAAKVIYNASGDPAPFDNDSGAWLISCAREFADCLADDIFTDQLWESVSSHIDNSA